MKYVFGIFLSVLVMNSARIVDNNPVETAGKQMLEVHDLQTRNVELDEDTAEQDHEEIEEVMTELLPEMSSLNRTTRRQILQRIIKHLKRKKEELPHKKHVEKNLLQLEQDMSSGAISPSKHHTEQIILSQSDPFQRKRSKAKGHIMILNEGGNSITSEIVKFIQKNIPSSDVTILSNLKKGSTKIVDSILTSGSEPDDVENRNKLDEPLQKINTVKTRDENAVNNHSDVVNIFTHNNHNVNAVTGPPEEPMLKHLETRGEPGTDEEGNMEILKGRKGIPEQMLEHLNLPFVKKENDTIYFLNINKSDQDVLSNYLKSSGSHLLMLDRLSSSSLAKVIIMLHHLGLTEGTMMPVAPLPVMPGPVMRPSEGFTWSTIQNENKDDPKGIPNIAAASGGEKGHSWSTVRKFIENEGKNIFDISNHDRDVRSETWRNNLKNQQKPNIEETIPNLPMTLTNHLNVPKMTMNSNEVQETNNNIITTELPVPNKAMNDTKWTRILDTNFNDTFIDSTPFQNVLLRHLKEPQIFHANIDEITLLGNAPILINDDNVVETSGNAPFDGIPNSSRLHIVTQTRVPVVREMLTELKEPQTTDGRIDNVKLFGQHVEHETSTNAEALGDHLVSIWEKNDVPDAMIKHLRISNIIDDSFLRKDVISTKKRHLKDRRKLLENRKDSPTAPMLQNMVHSQEHLPPPPPLPWYYSGNTEVVHPVKQTGGETTDAMMAPQYHESSTVAKNLVDVKKENNDIYVQISTVATTIDDTKRLIKKYQAMISHLSGTFSKNEVNMKFKETLSPKKENIITHDKVTAEKRNDMRDNGPEEHMLKHLTNWNKQNAGLSKEDVKTMMTSLNGNNVTAKKTIDIAHNRPEKPFDNQGKPSANAKNKMEILEGRKGIPEQMLNHLNLPLVNTENDTIYFLNMKKHDHETIKDMFEGLSSNSLAEKDLGTGIMMDHKTTVMEDYRNNKVEVEKDEVNDFYDKEEKDDYDSFRPNSMAGRFFNSHKDLNQEDDNNNELKEKYGGIFYEYPLVEEHKGSKEKSNSEDFGEYIAEGVFILNSPGNGEEEDDEKGKVPRWDMTKKIFHWPGGNIINIFNFDKDSNNEDINSQRKIVIKRTGEVLL